MDKYIIVDIPGMPSIQQSGLIGQSTQWWLRDSIVAIILQVEADNPDYEFHQLVGQSTNGHFSDYIIMKLIVI